MLTYFSAFTSQGSHFFSSLLFMPHGHCYHWLPSLVGLHVFSDSMIGLSYVMIPFALAYFIYKRADIPFGWMFICFSLFILSCGTTHFMEVWTLWHPDYWLAGFIKLFTAVISFLTAILLIRLIPFALKLPSPTMLRKVNAQLASEVDERKRKEVELAEVNLQLHTAMTMIQQTKNELVLKNAKLEEASRLKSLFLANMSHELRTPLNAIIGFSEIMYYETVGPVSKQHQEYLGDILSSSRHLLRLINDILDLSKIESGKMVFYPEPVHLPELVDDVINILRTAIANKQIKLQISVSSSLNDKEIVIDPAKFKQILYNYVSNAIKFTEDHGQIDLTISPAQEGYFRLEVKDTGIGIHETDVGKLFVEFQQLDSSANKKYPGTGLGLALTKQLVEAQGGRISVSSVPGKGSIFSAVLPEKPTQKPVEKEISEFVFSATVNGSPKILVIEDNPNDQETIKNTLLKSGYSVEVATTGKQALQLIKNGNFAGITLDLFLPDMTGWDLLKLIRSEGNNKDIPVIVITIVSEKEASLGFLISDFLIKPVQAETLAASLEKVGINPSHSKKIMVIDDNIKDLNLIKAILKDLEYAVILESNSKKALARFEEIVPDAIILDLVMPSMNGFEFLTRLRQIPAGQHVPVIVWTSKNMNKEESVRLQNYAQAVIPKGENTVLSLLTELKYFISSSDKKTGD